MSSRLVIEGNSVYEIDEECLACSREPRPATGMPGRAGDQEPRRPRPEKQSGKKTQL